MEISIAAKRIAKEHNRRIDNGFANNGFLVFDKEGNGGAWYKNNAKPDIGENIVIYMQKIFMLLGIKKLQITSANTCKFRGL